jgi:hypothetical protein
MSEPETSPPETKPPGPLSKPREFIEHHLQKDYPNLKAAWPSSLIIICVFGSIGYWLREHIDEERLNVKDATIQYETSRANGLQAEHEKLFKENADLKTANAELTSPLKKRVLTLSKQLKQFAEGCTNIAHEINYHNAYDARFAQRVYKTIAQLDEEGQTSAQLYDAAQRANFQVEDKSNNVMIVSKELERLATRLKDPKASD